ncbi:MAG: T9SS type A sorting domain-containing protein [Bacteroidia bacterium]
MNSPKSLITIIALLLINLVNAQNVSTMHVMPVTIDQLIAKPIDKYDTLSTPDAPCTTAPNDYYANAITLTVGAAAVSGHSCGGLQPNEALGCNSYATQSVWYKVTATASVTYVVVDATGASCYAGTTIWPATGLPTIDCNMIDCQSAANGPYLNVFKLTGAVGTVYAIQVTYLPTGPCGKEATFTIAAANSYGGTINNPGPVNSCSTPYNGCYFTSTPTTGQITSSCTAYPLISQSNLVNTAFYKFTTAPVNSNVLNFQDLLTSSCGGGNVSWFSYRLYDQYCNLLSCGDLGNLQNNVACNQPYVLEYSWEEIPGCTYSQHSPYQYVPTGTIGCGTPLPIELVTFEAKVKDRKSQLKWITAKENNNDYFQIERSRDNILYERVGKINGKGNTSIYSTYNFEDVLPDDGRFYYRLKQVDINGDYKYSKAITVASFTDNSALTIKNPASENVEMIFENENATIAQISFINSTGQVCAVEKWDLSKGMNKKTCSVNNLKPGIYTVIVTTEFFTCHQKLVKV